jgi:hypothetical protein
MKQLTIILALFISVHAFGQTDTSTVVVHKDPRIDMLVKKQVEINEITTRNSRRFVAGYRNKALSAKSKLYQQFPDLTVYLMYQAPYYKLKAGNFKERKDADDYLPNIQRLFPAGVYVIRDTIEVNPDPSAN